MSSVCVSPEVTLPLEPCEEPRYRSKHSFSESRRRYKHKSKDKNKSSKKQVQQKENKLHDNILSDTEDIEKENMTVIEKKVIEQDLSGRFKYDGFGNLITYSDTENEIKDGGDCIVKLEDISKSMDTDKMGSLAWLCGNDQYSDTQNAFYTRDPGLSQSVSDTMDEPVKSHRDFYPDEERLEIEAEIKRKFAELEELMDKIQAVKNHKRRRRHSRRRKVSEGSNVTDADAFVNIIPTRRERRLAQPIRNALLIRTAMKKAWRGALGSCCGTGCWAHWKWINLRHVMSDYE